ncbi:MAG: hypothetical protein GX594_04740 [Pirellulaceae bacterium]|nr:hypothetical protein [Pirellulaceae bacterium]
MRKSKTPPTRELGSIHRDEVLPLREAARRMGWADRMIADVQKAGLKAVTIGRMKYTTGAAVYDFVSAQLAGADEGGGQ